jgi:tRNA 2-thiouridine synthesizing protein A
MKTLHLLRAPGASPPVEDGDTVLVYDDTDPALVVDAIAAHDRVVVWPEETLDLTGEVCPFTFVRTKLRLEELPRGAVLRVVVDHEPAARNVPRSTKAWGQSVLSVEAAGPGRWVIVIRKDTAST